MTEYSCKALTKVFNLPLDEKCVYVSTGALKKHISHYGRLYISQNYVCFYSNMLGKKIKESIPFKSIKDIRFEVNREFPDIFDHHYIILETAEQTFRFCRFGEKREEVFQKLKDTWKPDEIAKTQATNGESKSQELDEDKDTLDKNLEEELNQLVIDESESCEKIKPSDSHDPIITEELPISVKKLFLLFYSDKSDFPQEYHNQRGDLDLKITKWKEIEEKKTFVRTLTYTAPTKSSFGPSKTRVEEIQYYHLHEDALLLNFTTIMLDIPYHDSFRIEGTHQVQAIEKNKCTFSVLLEVRFMKKTIFEGKIRSSTLSQNKESWDLFIHLMKKKITTLKVKKKKTKKKSSKEETLLEEQQQQPSTKKPSSSLFQDLIDWKFLFSSLPIIFLLFFIILLLGFEYFSLLKELQTIQMAILRAKPFEKNVFPNSQMLQ